MNIKNKKLIFFLSNDELLIYEIKEGSLNIIKKISHKQFFSYDSIKYYFIFKYKNNIMFNIFSYRQINLYLFDYNNIEFILKKGKNYSNDISNKYFYYMKKNNKFIIFNCDEAIIYDTLISKSKNIKIMNDNNQTDLIHYFKELNNNLLCLVFSDSISLYNLELEQFIGTISDIRPNSVKLIKNFNGKNNLMILSFGYINIYELGNLFFVQKLDLDKIKSIKKMKQLSNLDICIIYGDYNLAIYDQKKNVIKYQIKNPLINNIYYSNYFHLKEINRNILMYNPTRYTLHIINYIKGQVIAKFTDGLNKIIKCKKIKSLDVEDDVEPKENIKYYYIINSKGYFIFLFKNL